MTIRLSLFALIFLKSFSLSATLDEFRQELIEAARSGSLQDIENILNTHQLPLNEISDILLEAYNIAQQNNHEDTGNRLMGLYEVSIFSSDSENYEGDYYENEGDEGDEGDDIYLIMEDDDDEDYEEIPMMEIIQTSHCSTSKRDAERVCALIARGYQPQNEQEKEIIMLFLQISLGFIDDLSEGRRNSADIVSLKNFINQTLVVLSSRS